MAAISVPKKLQEYENFFVNILQNVPTNPFEPVWNAVNRIASMSEKEAKKSNKRIIITRGLHGNPPFDPSHFNIKIIDPDRQEFMISEYHVYLQYQMVFDDEIGLYYPDWGFGNHIS